MKRIGYIQGARIKGSVNLGSGGSLNAPGGFIGAFSFGFGNIYYVDAAVGLNTNDGLSPQKPLLTLAAALAKCVDGHEDYIVARGNFTDSALTITKSKVHLIGLLGGYGQSYLTQIQSGASATGATILIQAIDVEIANLRVMGNRDPGFHYPAILADGANSGTRSHIHDVTVPMLTPSGTQYCHGIHLVGDRHTVERCLIENSDVGILIDETGGVTTYRIVLSNIVIRACDIGLSIQAVSEAVGRHGVIGEDLHIDGNGANAVNRAIIVGGLGGYPSFLRAHMCGYGANQAATVTVGNGKFSDCTWAGLTGVSAAMA